MNDDKEIGVYILASGKGTRMGDVTKTVPKPLLTLHGKPIIYRLLDYLLSCEIFNINVNYAYLKDKWEETIKKYHMVNFYNTSSSASIVECFFNMLMQNGHKENTIVLMSADIFFDYRIIKMAVERHKQAHNDVSLVLNKSSGRWKKWQYSFKNDEILDIQIADSIQPIERYFLIFSADILSQYTNGYTKNVGQSLDEFEKNNAYGKGLCFLVKNMLDFGIRVNYQFYDNTLININSIDDFKDAEALAAEIET